MAPTSRDARIFWGAAVTVVVLDIATKWFAERYLTLHVPTAFIGDYVRWTLAYNPGAAFSMSLGRFQRYIFGAFAVAALVILYRLFREGHAGEKLRALALGLAWGGALGNLIDRIRHPRGVVDFIDVGIGMHRFWTFNVADSGVTVGAILLALVLLREGGDGEDRADERSPSPADG